MLIIAHRGASASEKENTREAFLAAHELGSDAIETDARRCKFCGKLVLSHDPILTEEDCAAALSLEDFLNIKVDGAYLPLSDEKFFLGEQIQLHIEIKEKGLVHEILEMTQGLRYRDKIVFSSFLWRELCKIRFFEGGRPSARIGFLWESRSEKIPYWAIALAGILLDAESIHVDFSMVNTRLVGYFRERGFSVYAYTVNHHSDIYSAWQLGLDGIFTDRPGYAREILSEAANIVPQ
ncbi:hypothetical protein A2926_00730 [Candidatus Giovannonibacteria bacterium RIFCSPLOWO2_01_FULL_44_40]|uniref:GP-PDE domain-containing protein n=1 Tax=Candidatus Giovannonibacteria bacterium RIFCSPHIGHO2_01_FULL_45_23 TaxID=1798325 RepID=A0A1F5VEM2_9BACT|nr:MAG: hypothetical protein A2834_00235 [Candidatus Giovannonibacteria bacterium RIFCSPHIGHO2_01_FULL_45_23]OGF76477.1 MAG: hypothetical protein A3C77_02945 [Candidatus Giovannonibacteria bacterium RIFCSPHIGHO2_02_FULL_45_13]OGF79604.1 MAG: hypothetical protein A2926_00730 [Candidatus Giovannonibacteria bacterium RIFCSPLOWO2_01_FULL_44_40]